MTVPRLLANLVALGLIFLAHVHLSRTALAWARRRGPGVLRATGVAVGMVSVALVAGGLISMEQVQARLHVPYNVRGWLGGGAYLWAFASTGAYLVWLLLQAFRRRLAHSRFDPRRRRMLEAAGAAAAAIPLGATAFGAFIQRTDFRVTEVSLSVPGLPPDLEGLRIAQISDIHLSPFLSVEELARVIDSTNELRPHLTVVTGDLISMAGDPIDACLRQVARLRSDAGVLGCLGNHEIYAGVEDYTAREAARLGVRFLRGSAVLLRFGNARLNVAGVDHQSVRARHAYLRGAQRLVDPGAVNLLLTHNPDVFPVAAAQGFAVTLAGHTHGGQVTVELLHQTLNVARFVTPYVYGKYALPERNAALYVTRGIGTIGIPVRLGAPPEIALVRLTRAG